MSDRLQKRHEDAKKLERRLLDEGRPRDAEVIRALCQSAMTSRTANRQLWRDNQALRAATDNSKGSK